MSKHKKAAIAAKLSKDKMACNKPRRTPGHKTKSHVVKACDNGKEKIIRFGQQGVKGAGKNPQTAKDKARKKSYYARQIAVHCIRLFVMLFNIGQDLLQGQQKNKKSCIK